MSPWWRDQLMVRLAPGDVRLIRYGRGFRRVAQASAVVPAEPGRAPQPWASSLDALAGAVQQDKRWRAGGVAIELSSAFCRWMLLQPNAALATDEEWLAYAQVELEAIHGDRARNWEIRFGEQSVGTSVPVCAIDRSLIDAARAMCTRFKMKLDAIEPAFAVAFNAHRAALHAPVSGFAHVDGDRLVLAIVHRGRWAALSSGRVRTSLVHAIESELIGVASQGLVPVGARRLYVVDDSGRDHAVPPRLGDWDVVKRDAASEARRMRRPGRVAAARTHA